MTAVFPPALSARARQLSVPSSGFDDAFFEAVICLHAEEVVAAFLESFSDELSRGDPDLVAAIQPPWDNAVPARAVWDPAVGAAERLLESGEGDPVTVAALIGLRLAEAGRQGAWSASFAEELTPRFGRWLLPRSERIAVRGDGRSVRIETQAGSATKVVALTAGDDGWTSEEAEQLVRVPGPAAMYLLPESAVREQLAIEDEFHSVVGFPEPSASLARIFGGAMSLMEQAAPDYHDWVARILRALVPCECSGSRTRSSSWREAPGVILISTAPSAPAVAEMLVHESCHQYFYLAKRLGDVVTGADQTLYYSPAVARPRPLDRVLLAYHAFANVLLLYESLRRAGAGDTHQLDETIAKMRADVEVLAEPLRDNEALSPIGRALVEPLLECLHR